MLSALAAYPVRRLAYIQRRELLAYSCSVASAARMYNQPAASVPYILRVCKLKQQQLLDLVHTYSSTSIQVCMCTLYVCAPQQCLVPPKHN